MNERNNIQQELDSMGSPLAGLPGGMPYAVPEGYFERLPAEMVNVAKMNEDSVPDFGKQMPFSVPSGYFDELPGAVLERAKIAGQCSKETHRTIAFVPRFKWVAAAVLAIVIGVGSVMVFMNPHQKAPDSLLSAVPKNEINAYIQGSYGFDAVTVLNSTHISNLNVDSKDIEAYLNETGWD